MKTDAHWKKIGMRPHHGVCLPLFALKTKKNRGIGEFLDLIPVIRWCREVGFDCLQLLPLNDTGTDPSPYNPISSCALDPVYLSLDLESTASMDRSALKALKLSFLKHAFEREFSYTPDYRSFLDHSPWLPDYSRFMSAKNGQDPDFYRFVQYLCFTQLRSVRKAADEAGVFLIGDMQVSISPESADVWSQPHLFSRGLSAGAPPDKYNPLGQKWGFPLFDWDAMRRDHFSWWKRRFDALEPFYHIYRIDHVVGFFRIWAIENGQKPSEGRFIPPDPSLWPEHGRSLLEMMIRSSPLLPIAEDLGTIPPEIYPILKSLGIAGTKVFRWEASITEPLSLTTVSTPDMEPLALWWEKYPEEAAELAARKGWDYKPHVTGPQTIDILCDAHRTPSYFHINPIQEYLFPFPELRHDDLKVERINVPGTMLPTNWTYRLRTPFEEVALHQMLAQTIRRIISG